MKPYYESGGITIYHGDCSEIAEMLTFNGLVLTDPPYGIDNHYHGGGRGRRHDPAAPTTRIAGDRGPFDPGWMLSVGSARIIWGANYFAPPLPPKSGWLVWDKERPDALSQSTCELAWTDCVKGVRRFRHLWDGFRRASENDAPLRHPTQKPVALMRWCLGLPGVPVGAVLDPYVGVGGVLLAARELGRPAIGIEIEERYCEIAARRLDQEVLDLGA